MATLGSLNIFVNGKTEGFEKAAKKTEGILGSLMSKFGKKSDIGELLHLTLGGAIFAGVSKAAHEFEEITEKAKEFAAEIRKGSFTTGEIAEKSIQLVPIVGNVYTAFRNVAGIVTGIDADLEQANEFSKGLDDQTKAYVETMKELKKVQEEYNEEIRKGREELELASMPKGHEKDIKEIDVKAADEKAEEEKKFKQRQEEAEKRLHELQTKHREMRSSMPEAPNGSDWFADSPEEYEQKKAEIGGQLKIQQQMISQVGKEIENEKKQHEERMLQIENARIQKGGQAEDEYTEKVRQKNVDILDAQEKGMKEVVENFEKDINAVDKTLDDFMGGVEKHWQDVGKKIYEESRTPLQKLRDELHQIKDAEDAGGLAGGAAHQARLKALSEYQKGTKLPKLEAEERRFTFTYFDDSAQQSLEEIERSALQESKTQTQIQRQTYNVLKQTSNVDFDF